MLLVQGKTRAYIYNGDWVGDCPADGCANAEHLMDTLYPGHPASEANPRTRRKPAFLCSYCHHLAEIDWPSDSFMEAAMQLLNLRPLRHTRNWYPQDHDVAVRAGIDHGQTVEELKSENAEHGIPCA